MRKVSGYMDKKNSFTYLGCPIYYERKNGVLFDRMLANIVKKLNSWQSNMLSYGGKLILIKHILQSLSIYIMSAMRTPKGVLNLMEKYLHFLWGSSGDKNKYHWMS